MRAFSLTSPSRRALLVACATALLGTQSCGERPPAGNAASPDSYVEIATVEHQRGPATRLDPFLAEGADPAARRKAIVALGRIGSDDDEVLPRLRMLLRRGGGDLALSLWAAGISGHKPVLPAVLAHLDEKDEATLIAAIEAVGMLGDARADGFLIPFLASDAAPVRTAAGYALSRAGSDRALEAVVAKAGEKVPAARRALAAAAWRCAGVRRRARTTKDAPWAGDPAAAAALTPLAGDADAETRIFALRALNAVWPKTLPVGPTVSLPAEPAVVAAAAIGDADPRVVADFVFRLLANEHDGPVVVRAVAAALENADALVRETAAESAGKVGSENAAAALRDRLSREPDARVRERIAIALAACGDDEAAAKVLAREDRPKDPGARATTEARVLLASKKPEPHAKAVAMLRDPKTPVLALEALLEGFGEVDHPDLGAALREVFKHPDPVVRGSAASLIGDKKLFDLKIEERPTTPDWLADRERDARQGFYEAALKETVAEIEDKKPPEKELERLRKMAHDTWVVLLHREPSASVRRTLLEKLETPEFVDKFGPRFGAEFASVRPKNDWHGLPRPKGPILGLDLSQGTGWLSEEEVLRLAQRIAERKPLLVVETEGLGVTKYRLDAEDAPVHAASTVIAATMGVYDGTPWHRVVPAFVIQGADPRGDGSGDAGWLLPDEITRRPFLRGALGMPKGVKDTGGCQLFVMHCYAPHLDGRYTAFGEAVEGVDVVDRIRVGDRIKSARVVVP